MTKKTALNINGTVKYGEMMSGHTTFGIGGPAEVWAEPVDENDLKDIAHFAADTGKCMRIVGWGSNVLVSDDGIPGVVVSLAGEKFTGLSGEGRRIKAGAGVPLAKFIKYACGIGLKGAEGLAGIPGCVGGALRMNAAHRTDMGSIADRVRVMDKDGNTSVLGKDGLRFGYRSSNLKDYIILEAEFVLDEARQETIEREFAQNMEIKKATQPLGEKSAGCVFKNPDAGTSAGRLIDSCGLKGAERGGARISEKHANFIVNYKFASSKDVLHLIKLAREKVAEKFGIELELELEVI